MQISFFALLTVENGRDRMYGDARVRNYSEHILPAHCQLPHGG